MTFYELLCKYSIEELWYILSMRHDLSGKPVKAERMFDLYKSAYSELIKLNSQDDSEKSVLVCELVIDNDNGGAPDSWVHCNILSQNEDGSGEMTKYAMDFVPWGELVGSKVSEDSLAKLGEIICAAELLWEITFYGFSSVRVDDESKKLQESINNINDGKSDSVLWNPEDFDYTYDKNTVSEIAMWIADAPVKVKESVYGFIAADVCSRDEDVDDIAVTEVLKRLKDIIDESMVKGVEDSDFIDLLRSMLNGLDIDERYLLLSKMYKD